MKKYTFFLSPLTAVHIGTGEVISPIEYAIGRINQKDVLFTFYPEKLVSLFNNEELNVFNNLAEKNDIVGLRSFLSEKSKSKDYIQKCINYIAWISEEFKKKYEETKNDKNNALEIATTYKGNNKIIIPGSSIKGAIRTSILNCLSQQEQYADYRVTEQDKRDDRRFQQTLLDYYDAKNDPFRAISLSDVFFEPKENLIVSPMMLSHFNTNENPVGINIYIEALKGVLFNPDISGRGEIMIKDEMLDKKIILNENKTFILKRKKFHNIDDLSKCINDFYNNMFTDEYNKVQEGKMSDSIKAIYDQIADYIDTEMKNKNEILIRIGRWSHIEAVTVEKYRKPFNRKGYGKTRTLIQYNKALYPMGWCAMKINI
ncbi:MAG TPA: type III-A CRISPR-associated RAMP protein Csm5 [Treponema sp.]|nr:type III-A CRISPR-associated RAMP protein Csm5 [Treponema sp.]